MRVNHSRWRVTPGQVLPFDPERESSKMRERERQDRQRATMVNLTVQTAPLRSGIRKVSGHVLLMVLMCMAAFALALALGK